MTTKQLNRVSQTPAILIYGETGSGKTLLAATIARAKQYHPVLYINADEGQDSIVHVDGLVELRVNTIDDMLSAVNQLSLPDAQRKNPVLKGVKAIIIDSLSALRDNLLIDLVENGILASQAAAKMDSRKKERTEFYPQLQDYGHLTFALVAMGRGLKQLRVPLIMTAGLDKKETENGTIVGLEPLLNPKIRQAINYMSSFIWYTDKRSGKHRLRVLDDPEVPMIIKSRNPLFVDALKADTRARAGAQGAKDLNAAEGWYKPTLDKNFLPTPGLDTLLELFEKSTENK